MQRMDEKMSKSDQDWRDQGGRWEKGIKWFHCMRKFHTHLIRGSWSPPTSIGLLKKYVDFFEFSLDFKGWSQLIGVGSKERIPLQSHWPRQEVHFWEKGGTLEGVGNPWAYSLSFFHKNWDVFGVRKEVKQS
jgi:hypothetical protein